MVKTIRFGEEQVPVPGFGAMGISFALGRTLSFEEAEPVLLKAVELGCTFWDTAVGVHALCDICSTDSFSSQGILRCRCKREAHRGLHPEAQLP